jgi:hypothetical protein
VDIAVGLSTSGGRAIRLSLSRAANVAGHEWTTLDYGYEVSTRQSNAGRAATPLIFAQRTNVLPTLNSASLLISCVEILAWTVEYDPRVEVCAPLANPFPFTPSLIRSFPLSFANERAGPDEDCYQWASSTRQE